MISHENYEFLRCTTAEQIEAAMRVRHEVFCIEKGWIDPATCARDIETDDYDADAVHFLALKDGVPVGTTRGLLGELVELPAFEYLPPHLFKADRKEIAEVSRLATIPESRTQDAFVFMGLCSVMWEVAMERSIRICMAIADVRFYRLLMRMQFPLIAKAKPVEHMGSLCVPVAFDVLRLGNAISRQLGRPLEVG